MEGIQVLAAKIQIGIHMMTIAYSRAPFIDSPLPGLVAQQKLLLDHTLQAIENDEKGAMVALQEQCDALKTYWKFKTREL